MVFGLGDTANWGEVLDQMTCAEEIQAARDACSGGYVFPPIDEERYVANF